LGNGAGGSSLVYNYYVTVVSYVNGGGSPSDTNGKVILYS
jgi:hypothetical protein